MNYPIKILKECASEHKKKIESLKNVEHEMYSSEVFTQEIIDNHNLCINKLNEAIKILLQ